MKLKIGISPCPNDTFIFDALLNKKIDTSGIEWEFILADVQALNQKAILNELDVTKLSYGAYPLVKKEYQLLEAGSALGRNCGPLLISKKKVHIEDLPRVRIGVPGKNTTANALLNYAFPAAQKKLYMLFSDIEQALLNDEIEVGLIIHENRFTYEAKGLHKIIDLGEYWETKTGLPIPLGGIVAHKKLGENVIARIDAQIRDSLIYAFAHPSDTMPFVKKYAQEMNELVMQEHIKLYVNDYSLGLGKEGHEAVEKLLEVITS
jgi:1,4-dihydroxy-6-naphthoate synthase